MKEGRIVEVGRLPQGKERIRLERRGVRFFAAFLICAALTVAAVAAGGVWLEGGGEALREALGQFWGDAGERTEEQTMSPAEGESGTETPATDVSAIPLPDGAIPVRDADLSCLHLGNRYFHNQSIHAPNLSELEKIPLSSTVTEEPLVLILHTHTTESYLPQGTAYLTVSPGEATYSKEGSRGVIAVGEALCESLRERGIPALHCQTVHDGGEVGSAYGNARESIRFFLAQYPSIRYVIDLHRDSVLDADGAFLRAVTEEEGMPTAQVMAVVGSDGGGEETFSWEQNLALAMRLRAYLNAEGGNLCRPVTLRNASYNQSLAPYSLLLEIGTGANSVEEAVRAARRVGEALAAIICAPSDAGEAAPQAGEAHRG